VYSAYNPSVFDKNISRKKICMEERKDVGIRGRTKACVIL
jgi:hypothetical protein